MALVLQYMALGQDHADALLRATGGRRYTRWIGAGLGIAWLTGVGAFAFGHSFLTSAVGHPVVPVLGELPLATAALFDLGVYVTVVGATMLMLSVLGAASKEAARHDAQHGVPARQRHRLVTAAGIYLLLRGRTFPVVLGLTLLGYAVNVFIFAMGRLWIGARRSSPRGRTSPTRCRRPWC